MNKLPPELTRYRKGRGALSNPEGRFESFSREWVGDEWSTEPPVQARVRTSLLPDVSRKLISRNDSPDIPFDLSINPYRGCEHGCAYCFARPSHAYLGLSPGLDFETRLFYKRDAASLLREELSRPGYRPGVMTLAANTDAYQPVERRQAVTRSLLEVLAEFQHPVCIVTKSSLVLRDLDLLSRMAEKNLVRVYISLTTENSALSRRLEPRATAPAARLAALSKLSDAGVSTGVLVAPVIPGLTDPEIESLLEVAAAAGARSAGYVMLRLPHELKDLFAEWLNEHLPDRAGHVMSLLKSIHGGRVYDARFGHRMRGSGPYAKLVEQRYSLACRRLGLNQAVPELDCSQFRPPDARGHQMDLFSQS